MTLNGLAQPRNSGTLGKLSAEGESQLHCSLLDRTLKCSWSDRLANRQPAGARSFFPALKTEVKRFLPLCSATPPSVLISWRSLLCLCAWRLRVLISFRKKRAYGGEEKTNLLLPPSLPPFLIQEQAMNINEALNWAFLFY